MNDKKVICLRCGRTYLIEINKCPWCRNGGKVVAVGSKESGKKYLAG